MSKKEQKSVVTFVLRSIQLWVGDENSDEDDDDMNGSEDEEGDDDDLDEAVGTGGGNAGR